MKRILLFILLFASFAAQAQITGITGNRPRVVYISSITSGDSVLTKDANGYLMWIHKNDLGLSGSGTVTSVAAGFGHTFATFTTSGSIIADTTSGGLASWRRLKYVIDSLNAAGWANGSRWTLSGSNIYFNTGNVTVGSASAAGRFYIHGQSGNIGLYLQPTDDTQPMFLMNNASGANNRHALFGNGNGYFAFGNGGVAFGSNNANGSKVRVVGATSLEGSISVGQNISVPATGTYTMTTDDMYLELPDLTGQANRQLTISSPTLGSTRIVMIYNKNPASSGFVWTSSIAIENPDGTTFTNFENQTVYILKANGTNWVVISKDNTAGSSDGNNFPSGVTYTQSSRVLAIQRTGLSDISATLPLATPSLSGLMSAADKARLDSNTYFQSGEGVEVQNINDSTYRWRIKAFQLWDSDTVTTTNTTITTASTITCPTDGAGVLTVTMVGVKADGTKYLTGEKKIQWTSAAGVVTLRYTTEIAADFLTGFTTATWTVDASGSTLRIRVTGEATENVEWSPTYTMKYHSVAL